MRKISVSLLALALAAFALPASAQSAGDWTLAVGAGTVSPKSSNGSLDGTALDLPSALAVDVGDSTRPTIAVEYFLRDNLGLEVLGALPFQHDIKVDGVGKVGSTRHLPPTISLQYHFNGAGRVSPLLGVGVNYTTFFSSKTTGALQGTDLSLGNSWGLAAHAGLDFRVGARGKIRVDARWIDIDTDVSINGIDVGSARIDPWVYGISYVMPF